MKKNNWKLATIVLAVICVVLLVASNVNENKDYINIDGEKFLRSDLNKFFDATGSNSIKVCNLETERCYQFNKLDE